MEATSAPSSCAAVAESSAIEATLVLGQKLDWECQQGRKRKYGCENVCYAYVIINIISRDDKRGYVVGKKRRSFKITFPGFIRSDGSNNFQSSIFDSLKPKIGCLSSITNRWTGSSWSDVWKKDVQVRSMSDLVIPVNALLGWKFDVSSLEAKNRVFELNHQLMNMF